MSEKFKGEVRPQEHAQIKAEQEKLLVNEVNEILDAKRVSINKSKPEEDNPEAAKTLLENITDEQVIEAIRKYADFSKFSPSFVQGLSEYGHPNHTSTHKDEKTLGTTRNAYIVVASAENGGIEVRASLSLVKLSTEKEPRITADLYTFNPHYVLGERGEGCPYCYGNGCWKCSYSGGY